MLNSAEKVQVSDTTMFNSITGAGNIIIKNLKIKIQWVF
jgi:hypothetical protein